MADKVASQAVAASPASTGPAAQVSPKKASAAKAAKPTHPRTSDMVNAAIETLKERGGSSLQAIKKYIATTYKVDSERQAPFIKRYLKSAVVSGVLVQTKGKGASGSFKIAAKADAPKVKARRAAPKAATAAPKKKTAASTVAAKKPAAAKKSPAAKKASPAASKDKRKVAKSPSASPVKVKSPSKAKKAAKAPTSKPKAPKPKKAVPTTPKAAAKASPKKAVAAKKK